MKKFTIHYKNKDMISILEVDCEKIQATEDVTIMWLNPGEFRARVNKPTSLYEKDNNGKLIPPVWGCHAFYDSIDECYTQLHKNLQFDLDKKKIFFFT